MANNEGFNITGNDNQPPVVTTQPKQILRHSISDEELDMLCETRTDMSFEILLIAIGALLGTLPKALPIMYSYFLPSETEPFSATFSDIIQLILFWAMLAVFGCMLIIFNQKSRSSKSLRDQIKDRTKGEKT